MSLLRIIDDIALRVIDHANNGVITDGILFRRQLSCPSLESALRYEIDRHSMNDGEEKLLRQTVEANKDLLKHSPGSGSFATGPTPNSA